MDRNPATQQDSTVWYCGRDGLRHAFPNAKIYFSWFPDFRNVVTVDRAALEAIPIGSAVAYRPGVRMVKRQDDDKVYVIARGGLLRWVGTESLAAVLYGADWRKDIDDLPAAFWDAYLIGEPVPTNPANP